MKNLIFSALVLFAFSASALADGPGNSSTPLVRCVVVSENVQKGDGETWLRIDESEFQPVVGAAGKVFTKKYADGKLSVMIFPNNAEEVLSIEVKSHTGAPGSPNKLSSLSGASNGNRVDVDGEVAGIKWLVSCTK